MGSCELVQLTAFLLLADSLQQDWRMHCNWEPCLPRDIHLWSEINSEQNLHSNFHPSNGRGQYKPGCLLSQSSGLLVISGSASPGCCTHEHTCRAEGVASMLGCKSIWPFPNSWGQQPVSSGPLSPLSLLNLKPQVWGQIYKPRLGLYDVSVYPCACTDRYDTT